MYLIKINLKLLLYLAIRVYVTIHWTILRYIDRKYIGIVQKQGIIVAINVYYVMI